MLLLVFPLNILAIWIGSAGLGLALSSVFPTLLVLGESRLKITGRITGLFFLGSSLGTMFVPTVMGQVFERFGSVHIITAMLTFACLGLGVLLLVIFTSSKVSKRTQN
jgi:fucose permease